MTQQLRKIGPVSCAKVLAILYAIFGLLIGAVLSLIFLITSMISRSAGMPPELQSGFFSFMFGIGSIIFFPVFYAVIGAISGLIMSALYNVVAQQLGGIEVDIS
jgi:hypothetical protein